MAQGIDTRRPVKSFDSDTEDRLLPVDHYRTGTNGRSGTSDKDSAGVVEGIRGNALVAYGAANDRVIVCCPDVKNNAVIRFVQNATAPAGVSFTSATVTQASPPVIVINGLIAPLEIGAFISILQGSNTFVGQVVSVGGTTVYTLVLVSGTASTGSVTTITKTFYNYIKRYYVSTKAEEFLINPVLMGPVLGWTADTKIYNPRLIEAGFTQLLVWTDPTPRMLDVDKMKQG